MTSMYGLSLGWRLAELPTSWAHQPRIERAPASIPLVGQEARRVCCVLRAAYAFFSVPIISVCDYAKSARAQAKRCRAVAKRTEERQARRHGGTMARWHDGTMARRHDGTMARWHDGTMARWHDGTMARWHDGTMARWHDGTDYRASPPSGPFSRKNGTNLRL